MLSAANDQRLKTLAIEAKLDTFTMVKEKIDAMIDALTEESAAEVKKKDFCLEEFQKNRLASDKKQRLLLNLDAKKEAWKCLEGLQTSCEELKMKMEVAGDDLATLQTEIKAHCVSWTDLRSEELEKQQTLASQNREKD